MSEIVRGGSDQDNHLVFMSERDEMRRLPYSPTPLNPYWFFRGGVRYIDDARDKTHRLFDQNLALLPRQPHVGVRDQLERSVLNALSLRCDNNQGKHLSQGAGARAETIFNQGRRGLATTLELVELLDTDPQLQSLELAKLTEPFVPDSPLLDEMDDSVRYTMAMCGATPPESPEIRHYFFGSDDMNNPLASVFIRKENIGTMPTVAGNIQFVVRDCFVMDLSGSEMREEFRELQAWLKSQQGRKKFGGEKVPYNTPSVVHRIESQYGEHPAERNPAIHFGVRSYYIHISN